MKVPRLSIPALCTIVMVIVAGLACAQNYPNRPIRIIAPEAGGGADFVTRQIAQGLTPSLGQPVVVENRGGASGAIAAQMTAKAPPDGYTLLLYSSSLWIVPLMQSTAQWDPIADFSPIALVTRQPNVLVVHPSLPAKSVKELIALAKNRPGALNYGTSGTGSSGHLAGELFKSMAGVNIIRIPYKGNAAALTDMIAGQLQLMFVTAASVAPHVKSGRLRALAVTSAQPSPVYPGLPTVASSGLQGYEAVSLLAMFAPAKTPTTVINRLNQEILRVLNRADVKENLFNVGVEAVGTSPEELGTAVKSEMTRLGKVIKDAGIKAE